VRQIAAREADPQSLGSSWKATEHAMESTCGAGFQGDVRRHVGGGGVRMYPASTGLRATRLTATRYVDDGKTAPVLRLRLGPQVGNAAQPLDSPSRGLMTITQETHV